MIAALTFVLVAGIVLGIYWVFVARPERLAESALQHPHPHDEHEPEHDHSFGAVLPAPLAAVSRRAAATRPGPVLA